MLLMALALTRRFLNGWAEILAWPFQSSCFWWTSLEGVVRPWNAVVHGPGIVIVIGHGRDEEPKPVLQNIAAQVEPALDVVPFLFADVLVPGVVQDRLVAGQVELVVLENVAAPGRQGLIVVVGQTSPWNSFPPDRVRTLTTPPREPPYSAL